MEGASEAQPTPPLEAGSTAQVSPGPRGLP